MHAQLHLRVLPPHLLEALVSYDYRARASSAPGARRARIAFIVREWYPEDPSLLLRVTAFVDKEEADFYTRSIERSGRRYSIKRGWINEQGGVG